MPKSKKTSCHKMENNPSQDESSTQEESGLEQENDQEVTLNPSHVQQVIPSMFIPYIEGPNMDWSVSDGLYHKYLNGD